MINFFLFWKTEIQKIQPILRKNQRKSINQKNQEVQIQEKTVQTSNCPIEKTSSSSHRVQIHEKKLNARSSNDFFDIEDEEKDFMNNLTKRFNKKPASKVKVR